MSGRLVTDINVICVCSIGEGGYNVRNGDDAASVRHHLFFKTMGSTFAKRNILTQLHVHIRWEITIVYIYIFICGFCFPIDVHRKGRVTLSSD